MAAELQDKSVNSIVENFFRHEFGKVVAHLCRVFGTSNIELIEDAVQDTLYKAMQVWPYKGTPDNPSGWILRASKNKVIDLLRHENRSVSMDTDPSIETPDLSGKPKEVLLDSDFKDDQLRLFFGCCHADLSPESQLILILKLLCGFSKTEIARALLKKEAAVAKAFTRAKIQMKSIDLDLESPSPQAIKNRLQRVIKVLYLLFNEGYKAAGGEALIRKDLCAEAIRLSRLLLENKYCNKPEVNALLALMCFQASRLDARLGPEGNLIPLPQQNRELWSKELIRLGNHYLNESAYGAHLTPYHLEASIAAFYSQPKTYAETDWKSILALHDMIKNHTPSPMALLNRTVVFGKVHGAEKALEELKGLEDESALQQHHLFYAIKAELYLDLGNDQEAIPLLNKAMNLAQNNTEKNYLRNKLEKIVLSSPA